METEEGDSPSITIVPDSLEDSLATVVEDSFPPIDDSLTEEIEEVTGIEILANQDNDTETNNNKPAKPESLVGKTKDPNRFPFTRIRSLMKLDPDMTISSQDSVYLITKAAELFVQLQAQEAYKRTKQAKRKTVQKRDLDATIAELDCMAFLEGAVD